MSRGRRYRAVRHYGSRTAHARSVSTQASGSSYTQDPINTYIDALNSQLPHSTNRLIALGRPNRSSGPQPCNTSLLHGAGHVRDMSLNCGSEGRHRTLNNTMASKVENIAQYEADVA